MEPSTFLGFVFGVILLGTAVIYFYDNTERNLAGAIGLALIVVCLWRFKEEAKLLTGEGLLNGVWIFGLMAITSGVFLIHGGDTRFRLMGGFGLLTSVAGIAIIAQAGTQLMNRALFGNLPL